MTARDHDHPAGEGHDPEDDGEANGHAGDHADPRLAAGWEHLQRAAHEVIAASRALLDVAEELVEDPKAAGALTDVLGSLGAFAARMGRPTGPTRPFHDRGD